LRLYRRANPDGNPRQLTSEAPGTPYGLAQPTYLSLGADAKASKRRGQTFDGSENQVAILGERHPFRKHGRELAARKEEEIARSRSKARATTATIIENIGGTWRLRAEALLALGFCPCYPNSRSAQSGQ
jgi:hypothetical protein